MEFKVTGLTGLGGWSTATQSHCTLRRPDRPNANEAPQVEMRPVKTERTRRADHQVSGIQGAGRALLRPRSDRPLIIMVKPLEVDHGPRRAGHWVMGGLGTRQRAREHEAATDRATPSRLGRGISPLGIGGRCVGVRRGRWLDAFGCEAEARGSVSALDTSGREAGSASVGASRSAVAGAEVGLASEVPSCWRIAVSWARCPALKKLTRTAYSAFWRGDPSN